MNEIKFYTVQTMKWTAFAGSYCVVLFGGLIAISWLTFQLLVYLTLHLP